MGWEIFHQVTLIFIPIYLTELTFKRKGNCNVMITGLVNHGLYVVLLCELHSWPIRDLSTSSFNLHRLHYELFFIPSHRSYNLISLVPTWPPISTSSFWSKSPIGCRLFVDQRFSGSGGDGVKGVSSRSTKKSH